MTLDELVNQLKLAYGGALRSVVLYGSAVAGEHIKKKSDYNVLVVVDSISLEQLRNAFVDSRNFFVPGIQSVVKLSPASSFFIHRRALRRSSSQ